MTVRQSITVCRWLFRLLAISAIAGTGYLIMMVAGMAGITSDSDAVTMVWAAVMTLAAGAGVLYMVARLLETEQREGNSS